MKKAPKKIIIEDISEGTEKGYMAIIPYLKNSLVFGENLMELAEGIELTIDLAKKGNIGKKKKITVQKVTRPSLTRN